MLAKVRMLCYIASNTQICLKQRNYTDRMPPSYINVLMVRCLCVNASSLPVHGNSRREESKKGSRPSVLRAERVWRKRDFAPMSTML